MPKHPDKRNKKKASSAAATPSAPSGPDDILAEAQMLLERGERKLRDQEPQKARALLEQAVAMVRSAGLADDPNGCLILATATGSLLQIDDAEIRLAGWARRGGTVPHEPSPMGSQVRLAALTLCADALAKGFAAASAAGAPGEERSHLRDTQAQVATLLSEECEAASSSSPTALKQAVEAARHAVTCWEDAGALLLASSVRPELAATVETPSHCNAALITLTDCSWSRYESHDLMDDQWMTHGSRPVSRGVR